MKNVIGGLLLLIGLFFTACKSDAPGVGNDAAFALIPAGVTSVTSIDVGSIMEKMDYDNMKTKGFFAEMKRELIDDGNQVLVDVLENPESSGIDLDQPVYVVYDIDPKNLESGSTYLLASLEDKSAFAQMVSKSTNASATVGEGFEYIQPDRQVVVGWTDEVAMIGGSQAYVDLAASAQKVFGTTKETSIADNKSLLSALTVDADLRSWLTLDAIAENPQAAMGLGMAQIKKEDLLGNYVHGYANFEDGKMVSHTDLELKKGLTKDLDKLFKDKPSMDVEDYVPGDGLVFVLSNSLSFRGLDEMLSGQPFVKGMVNQSLQEYGFSTEDLAKTFGGDIVVAGYTNPTDPSKVSGVFITDLLDTDRWNQFQTIALDMGLLAPGTDGRFVLAGGANSFGLPLSDEGVPQMLIKDDKVFVSADDALLAQIAGGANTYDLDLDGDAEEVVEGNLFGLFLNMAKLNELDEQTAEMQEFGMDKITVTANREDIDLLITSQKSNENFLKTMVDGVEAVYQRDQNR